ncbi:MAG: DUF932 domain-containing protein [Synechococcus sp.]
MKSGLTLLEMAQELQAQIDSKQDYVADTRQLELDGDILTIHTEQAQQFDVTDHTHRQIAQRLNIPGKYYSRLREQAPSLLSSNVNHWFENNPERRLVRTLSGSARAFLSNRYRRIDNYQIAEAALTALREYGSGLQIASIGLTESRLYIKAINQQVEMEVKKGDPVQAGVVISNSEIGLGSIRVEPLVYRLVCTNGLIAQDRSYKKYHVGREIQGEMAQELFSDETMQADDRALLLKVRDLVSGAVNHAQFESIVNDMREATERRIDGNPVKAVEVLADKMHFSQPEKSGVLTHLIQGGDLSAYGLMNAVTRTSQDLESYDRATEFEAMGSQVLNLPKKTWDVVATAV